MSRPLSNAFTVRISRRPLSFGECILDMLSLRFPLQVPSHNPFLSIPYHYVTSQAEWRKYLAQ